MCRAWAAAVPSGPASVALAAVLAASLAAALAGCNGSGNRWLPASRPGVETPVPQPVDLLLPRSIKIHPFTGTRTFGDAGGVRGIEVHVEALDAFDDSAKAFGSFRFELYTYKRNSPESKGRQMHVWTVDLTKPADNLVHWDKVHRNYLFKLQWDQPIEVGNRFLLMAVFESPFTERLTDSRVSSTFIWTRISP
jgi:hypothetical protein